MIKENKTRGLIILAVVFVMFSVIAFVVPFIKNGCFWMGYIFGVISIAFQIYVFSISFGGDDVKSKFYGMPVARIGVIYLGAQLILSIIEMALAAFLPAWVAVILNILLLGLAIIGCVAADTVRQEVIRQDNTVRQNVSNMRNLQSLSVMIAGHCSDEAAKESLNRLAESFRYSDPVSSEATMQLEGELLNMLNQIQRAAACGDYAAAEELRKKTEALLEERNRVCRLNK